jgi:Ni,Fe-hydrogenase I large subunit
MAASQLLQDHVIHFYHLAGARLGQSDPCADGRPAKPRKAAAKVGYRETSVEYFARRRRG